MQRRFLITSLIFVLGFAGVWLYLAEQFEKMVESEIIPVLKRDSVIVKANLDDIKIDKYKFKIHLGNVDLLPNSDLISYSFEEVDIAYNPFKDRISLNVGGSKLSITYKYNYLNIPGPYVIKNPQITVSFDRNLSLNNIFDADYHIEYKSQDTGLYSATSDELIVEQDSSTVVLSHTKDGEKHIFRIGSESNNVSIIPNPNMGSTEVMTLGLINTLLEGRSAYSFEISMPNESIQLIKDDIQDYETVLETLLGRNVVVSINPITVISVLSADIGARFDLKYRIGTPNEGSLTFDLDKKLNSELNVNFSTNMHMDEKLSDAYAGLLSHIISNNDFFFVNKDDLLTLIKKYHSGSSSSSISFSALRKKFVNNLKITHNGKVAELKGEYVFSRLNQDLSIDHLIDLLDYIKSYAGDFAKIIQEKSPVPNKNSSFNYSISNFNKFLDTIIPASKDLAKLLNKTQVLNPGDTFQSSFKICLDVGADLEEINEQDTESFLKDPKFVEILKTIKDSLSLINIKILESDEAGGGVHINTELHEDSKAETNSLLQNEQSDSAIELIDS